MKTIINTINAPKPVGPYSQAVKAGKFLFISGQLAIDPKEGKIIAPDIKAQTARIMENIKAILEVADFDLVDVVQTSIYLSSMTLLSDFNNTYAKYFDNNFPARATVVIQLMPGALVEISAVAYKE
jgi:2-iminobutanoate/2-iminopropanoate deaminase